MRFLVFNVVVLFSIGYLFTAVPGQSVGSWLDDTIDTISKVANDRAEMNTIQKSELALPIKPLNGNSSSQITSAGTKLTQPVVQPPVASALEDRITIEGIQRIINDSISTNLQQIAHNLHPSVRGTPTPKVTRPKTKTPQTQGQVPSARKANTMTSDAVVLDNPKVAAQPDKDEALATAFRELYPAEVIKEEEVAANKPVPIAEAAPSSQAFMTPSDRQSALSELIQNLQLTYVARVGD
jgi:hypothetical protein